MRVVLGLLEALAYSDEFQAQGENRHGGADIGQLRKGRGQADIAVAGIAAVGKSSTGRGQLYPGLAGKFHHRAGDR